MTTSPRLEEVPECPLCGASEAEFIFRNIDRLHGMPGEFGLVRCASCDLFRLSPRPAVDELASYYPADAYYSYQKPEDMSVFAKPENPRGLRKFKERLRDCVLDDYGYPVPKLNLWQRALKPLIASKFRSRAFYGIEELVPRFVPDGRALDIGCGNAEILAYLKLFGWKVDGVDFNAAAAVAAKEHFGIDVFVGPVEAAPFAPETFDFIRMSHVIEHLPDVVETMKHIASLLKPGGVLYVETPNIGAFSFRHSREYWYPLECPRHLFLFTPKTLAALLAECGIVVTNSETFFYDTYKWEDTYREEERTGALLDPRPQTLDPARAERLIEESRREHASNPDCGDIIRAWAVKR